ncbi:DUF2243 domain-containing protein [Microvirga arsenatis]|uniref:DUF2243 domain-containing protein n=1 Tax=Microvirga arsenatis TaxID=2692265 RepID=A0ABW9Z0B8_9HYPH|nr:DUF2243 domain-containing protein [Microvirga arsenatis]NBJ12059.1 DUF2243 domain-containing protein [Microvirga arsenatis]NBJ25950.1 DUF2243 domain-containing protein [Microvirga arsenatis]
MNQPRTATKRRRPWAGHVLGFALGGFFDGILLHQILQWHHLLSAIDGDDLRFQVAADGYFHALMYGVAAVGLWMLWTSERGAGRASGRLLLAAILIGFGIWHAVDAVLSHWLLGIHRIRMDSPHPLVWDLLWLGLFGLTPLILGGLIGWKSDGGQPPSSRSSNSAGATATLMVIGAGALGIWPLRGGEFTTVLFAPGLGERHVMRALAEVDAELVWADPGGGLAVVRLGKEQQGWSLYGKGAILVTGSGLPAGCFNSLKGGPVTI